MKTFAFGTSRAAHPKTTKQNKESDYMELDGAREQNRSPGGTVRLGVVARPQKLLKGALASPGQRALAGSLARRIAGATSACCAPLPGGKRAPPWCASEPGVPRGVHAAQVLDGLGALRQAVRVLLHLRAVPQARRRRVGRHLRRAPPAAARHSEPQAGRAAIEAGGRAPQMHREGAQRLHCVRQELWLRGS